MVNGDVLFYRGYDMKRKRSVVVENDQWVDVYTMPDGTKHVVYLAPYKAPTLYQSKLALKRAGVELPQIPPACQMTEQETVCRMMFHIGPFDSNHKSDPRGLPIEYFHLGRWHELYRHRQYRISGPALTARQKFEQHLYENRFNDHNQDEEEVS